MTEEEYFRKNFPDSCYGDKPLSPHWDYFQYGVEFGERQSEEKIKELEQKLEQTEKDLADYQFNYPTIKELKKENAELRKVAEFQQSSNMSRHFENKQLKEGLAVGSTFNKALNSMNKNLEEERDKYRNMVFDKDDQLTKAKEILKAVVDFYPTMTATILLEAEQFLNSEVEK